MKKLLIHLGLLSAVIILLNGCTSGGSLPDEEEPDLSFDPLPVGLPVYAEVVEPYIARINPDDFDPEGKTEEELELEKTSEDPLAFFSYKPQETASGASSQPEILAADSQIIVALNTESDTQGEAEFTLVESSDNVYLVNHANNQIRLLSHFINEVCEIIPAERVEKSEDQLTFSVLHDELVYVMTAENDPAGDSCTSDTQKRYYALPLDHQLDASKDEDGEIESLDLVTEAVARSKLIFGWMPDPDNVGQQRLEYAFLGFDGYNQMLTLFDENKEQVWTQARRLQEFDVVEITPKQYSDKYQFHVQALENYQYLIQLGLDVFVVDSGRDLMSKTFNQTDTILADKTLTLSEQTIVVNSANKTYRQPATAHFDNDDLLVIDGAKIYQFDYLAQAALVNPSSVPLVKAQNPLMFDNKDYRSKRTFSQFDLRDCDQGDVACADAHDVEAQMWQFFTACEPEFGCNPPDNSADNCQTLEEQNQTGSSQELCTVSDYRHIAELNDESNDAELKAFMQYHDDYVRQTDFILQDDRLLVTAKMQQKDVFLAYYFDVGFEAAKSLREQVFFGKRAALTGMEAYLVNDNLFLTALQKGAVRSNECYKNYQRVSCDPSEVEEEGANNTCTGLDLELGTCVNSFREYESKAFFCTELQLDDQSCSDANLTQLDELAIEDASEDGKWLPVYDYASSTQLMYLLIGNHTLALKNFNLDEGKLYLPSLFEVDMTTGQKGAMLTSLDGTVESVVGGWLIKEPALLSSEVFGRINLISEEVVQHGGRRTLIDGRLNSFVLEQTFENETVVDPEVTKAPEVAEILFERPE